METYVDVTVYDHTKLGGPMGTETTPVVGHYSRIPRSGVVKMMRRLYPNVTVPDKLPIGLTDCSSIGIELTRVRPRADVRDERGASRTRAMKAVRQHFRDASITHTAAVPAVRDDPDPAWLVLTSGDDVFLVDAVAIQRYKLAASISLPGGKR